MVRGDRPTYCAISFQVLRIFFDCMRALLFFESGTIDEWLLAKAQSLSQNVVPCLTLPLVLGPGRQYPEHNNVTEDCILGVAAAGNS